MDKDQDKEEIQFVVFQTGPHQFAVEINRVREIIRYRNVSRLPRVPAFVEGVIDLRGLLVPVVDLRKRFELDARIDDQTRILILRHQKKNLGLIVDAVDRVITVPLSDIKAPPAIAGAGKSSYMLAVVRSAGELFVVLDLEKILSVKERIKLNRMKLA